MSLPLCLAFILYFCCNTFGLSNETCSCYPLGTQESSEGQSICKADTLQCKCLPNVIGLNCNQCKDGYYKILSGQGCLSCQCNPEGTKTNSTCDARGKCDCKDGYKGYRCDQRVQSTVCLCDTLLENSTQFLTSQIIKINQTIETLLTSDLNSTDSETFKKHLTSLQDSIETLYSEVKNPFDNFQDQISDNINAIREQVTILIATLLKINKTDVANVFINYQQAHNLSEICKQQLSDAKKLSNKLQHNRNMTLMSKESKAILEDLLNIIATLSETTNYYESAKQNVQWISSNITILKDNYLEGVKNFRKVKHSTANTTLNAKISKAVAESNDKLLQELHFVVHNKTILCGNEEIPEYKNNLEETLSSHLENCHQQQNELEELFNKIKKAEEETSRLEKQNKKDSASLKAMYAEALHFIADLDIRVGRVLDVEDINDENENILLILEDELGHLIRKLELFSDQLSELEILSNRNLNILEDSQNQVNTSKINLEKLKELDNVIATVPISEKELLDIEREINKGNRYFELQEQIEVMKKEVKLLGDVAAQLEELPTNLCSADVHPEGKLP